MLPLGLSDNAWRNCKSYTTTAFPLDPVEGDRIFRTDTPIGNRWYTYWYTGGVGWWQPDYISGRTTLAGSNVTFDSVAITFPIEFAFAPSVVCSFGAGAPSRWLCYATNVTETGFTIAIATASSTAPPATYSAFVQWIAAPRS